MNNQHAGNHARYVPLWHFVTPTLILAVLIGSIINFVNAAKDNRYSASLLIVVSLLLAIIWWYERVFALKAQDRAIRAEENIRHFALTGKLLDKQLRLGQIIALRFAADEEFPALAKKAVEEKLSSKQIKAAITNWKGDFHRV